MQGLNRLNATGGGYTGDEALSLFEELTLVNIFLLASFERSDGRTLILGDSVVVSDIRNYMTIRSEIFHHTQKLRPLCIHEQITVARLIGAAIGLEAIIFQTKPPNLSSHDYVHVLHPYTKGQDHIASEKYTEQSPISAPMR